MTALLITLTAGGSFAAQAAPSVPLANANGDHAHRSEVKEDNGKWRRDPFIGADAKNTATATKIPTGKKSVAESSNLNEINLQGIMQADKAFHALINGRVVKTGDKLDGVTIKEITRYQVVVQNEKKEKSIYDIHKGKILRGEK